jgi:hypothetical protein
MIATPEAAWNIFHALQPNAHATVTAAARSIFIKELKEAYASPLRRLREIIRELEAFVIS